MAEALSAGVEEGPAGWGVPTEVALERLPSVFRVFMD